MKSQPTRRTTAKTAIGDYLLVHYLWGSISPGLLDEFWAVAPERLRKHVMWFLGNEMRRGADMPADIRARGRAYWEMRLAAGEAAKNREHFRGELGAIGSWTLDTVIPSDWLLAQMLRMLKAGYAPSNSYSVIEWAAKISPQHPDDAVELIKALFWIRTRTMGLSGPARRRAHDPSSW